jgi:hypothetical protein
MSCANLKGLDWPDPDFEVVNIGLTEEQIDTLDLMKIGNLETGGGRDLSDPRHPDHFKPYVQDYIARFGCGSARRTLWWAIRARRGACWRAPSIASSRHPSRRYRGENEPGKDIRVAQGTDGLWYAAYGYFYGTGGCASPITHSPGFAGEREAIEDRAALIQTHARQIAANGTHNFTDGDRAWARKIDEWCAAQLAPQQLGFAL